MDLILESIASLDPDRITDPQLKSITESLREVGGIYYDPYMVMVKPGLEERVRWPVWMTRVAVPAAALFAGSAVILLLVLLLFAR
ncbi:MAG: hypothetical protein GY769_19100 [bacterium]|nr:hypothetical protein [bacterium]